MKNILRLLALLLCVSGLVHAEHRVFTKKDGFLSMRDKLNVYFFRSDTHRKHRKGKFPLCTGYVSAPGTGKH